MTYTRQDLPARGRGKSMDELIGNRYEMQDAIGRGGMDREAALVKQSVVVRAEQREIVEAGLPAVRPVLDVMRVNVARVRATRERATAIARP